MAIPTTRNAFAQWCLTKLGYPVIKIDVSQSQIDDRIDEAINMYQTYHFDGSQVEYYRYEVQQADIDNKYIVLPNTISGAVRIFDLANAYGTTNIFSVSYQIAMSDVWRMTSMEVAPYWMAMSNLQFLQDVLVGSQPIRYNKNDNVLHIDMDWSRVTVGMFIVVECYELINPDNCPDIWSDYWLQRYATALIKRQWGENLDKMQGMNLVGDMKFNGDKILEGALKDLEKLERELQDNLTEPIGMKIH